MGAARGGAAAAASYFMGSRERGSAGAGAKPGDTQHTTPLQACIQFSI